MVVSLPPRPRPRRASSVQMRDRSRTSVPLSKQDPDVEVFLSFLSDILVFAPGGRRSSSCPAVVANPPVVALELVTPTDPLVCDTRLTSEGRSAFEGEVRVRHDEQPCLRPADGCHRHRP